MIQIFWCLCNLAWFTSKLYILLLQISFYLSPNRAKQISLLFWSTPSWISYSPSIQSKNPRFVDTRVARIPMNRISRSKQISRFTQARRSKVPDKRIAIPVMRFAFSPATTFPQTFDSHPSASGGSQLLGERAFPPCSYRDWTISKPSATNSVRLANRAYSRICRIS